MNRSYRLILFIIICLIPSVSFGVDDNIFFFPTGEPSSFSKSYGLGTYHLQFKANGTYEIIDSGDVYLDKHDVGLWHQSKNGNLILNSEKRYHSIICGKVMIYINEKKLGELQTIQKDIKEFLNKNSENFFSVNTVLTISRYKSKYLKDRDDDTVPNIFGHPYKITDFKTKDVPQNDILCLSEQIYKYKTDENKNKFRLKAIKYKSFVFLVDLDELNEKYRNANLIKNVIDKIENQGQVFPPLNSYVYVKYTNEEFNEVVKRYEWYFEKNNEMSQMLPAVND